MAHPAKSILQMAPSFAAIIHSVHEHVKKKIAKAEPEMAELRNRVAQLESLLRYHKIPLPQSTASAAATETSETVEVEAGPREADC